MVIKKDPTPAEMRLKTNAVLKELLQLVRPMAPDGEMIETESTKNFVVPDHLLAGVAELKEIHPDASEERLANLLKYS